MRKKRSQSFRSVVTAGTARTPGGRRFVAASRTDGDTEQNGVEFGCSFGLPNQVARNLGCRDPAALQPDELASVFRHRFTPDTQKRRRREGLKWVHEEFDDNGSRFARKRDKGHARMIDRVELMSSAAAWMQARGWKEKPAKQCLGKQGRSVPFPQHQKRTADL